MPATIIAMLIILLLAVALISVVVVGMEGTGREQAPEVAHALARASLHLNGEADPPKRLLSFLEEAEDGAGEIKAIPETIRAAVSARSATSARSAASASEPDEDSVEDVVVEAVEEPAVPASASVWAEFSVGTEATRAS